MTQQHRIGPHTMKNNKTIATKILMHDVRGAAYHQAGCFLAAEKFGLNPKILLQEVDVPDPSLERTVTGRACFDHATPYQKCVIVWAGVIAEYMRDNDGIADPALLKAQAYDDYEESKAGAEGVFSAATAAAIAECPQSRRALTEAAKIVFQRKAELLKIVAAATTALVTRGTLQFHWPMRMF